MFVSNGGLLLSRTRFEGLCHCGVSRPVSGTTSAVGTRQYAEEAEIHKRRAQRARGESVGQRPRATAPRPSHYH